MIVSQIKALEPGQTLYDDKVTGLHARRRAGGIAFFFYYRTKTGRERRPKIGNWPTISLEAAREAATNMSRIVANGGDPVAAWAAEAEAETMADLCETYRLKHGIAKKSWADDKAWIDGVILPRFGKLRVNEVRRQDIEKMHSSLADTPYKANRVLALLCKMFNLAIAWQIIDRNPAAKIQRFREAKRTRYLKPAEARRFCELLTKYGDEYPQQAAFLWLLLYTGARPSEIAAVRPEQRVGNRLELDEHKTDRTGDLRVIYLPPPAVAVLDKLGRTRSGTLLGIKSPRHLWDKIVAEMGVQNLRMYDLRHSFASAGVAAGLSLAELGPLMGHRSTQTTARYAHLMESVGVDRAARTAEVITSMLGLGTASSATGNAGRLGTSSSLPQPRSARAEPDDSPFS